MFHAVCCGLSNGTQPDNSQIGSDRANGVLTGLLRVSLSTRHADVDVIIMLRSRLSCNLAGKALIYAWLCTELVADAVGIFVSAAAGLSPTAFPATGAMALRRKCYKGSFLLSL